jgi:two-component system NtrC family sensor kinase
MLLSGTSIRRKLLALVLLPLVGVLPLLGLVLLWWGDEAIDELLRTKVRSDLAVAQGYFDKVMADVGTGASTVAESHGLRRALQSRDPHALQRLLQSYRSRGELTYLNWRSPQGQLLVAHWGQAEGPPAELLGERDGRPHVAVIEGQAFAQLAPQARERVAVPILGTQGAQPSSRRVEDRAMVITAAAPVHDEHGVLLGHVQAGVLLNRNLDFIDRINDIVYPEGALPFGSRGTATLFLDDVRISTNVRLFEGTEGASGQGAETRAIGTRVSDRVQAAVLGEGRTWLDRAFVVKEWYVSAYTPLQDHRGERVGMLYVGFLERPFTVLKYAVLATIGALFFSVMIGASWWSLRAARGIFRPVERMELTMRTFQAGDAQARVGLLSSQDELGHLARGLDGLLDAISEKTRALEDWNAVLDAKVAERTAALQAAQDQLMRSEKLAVIGQLTAGMAHEINNPIAVIQGNLDLLRHTLGPQAEQVKTELDLAQQQVERMRLIVTQMLQFARPGDFAGYVQAVDPVQALEDSLVLTDHALRERGIRVQRDFTPGLRAAINRQELQQVLVNLVMNAVHAMPAGGTIGLSCRRQALDDGSDGVLLAVADEGGGLPESVKNGLFQPFVTHKKDGTGLGLWISRSIVERYGGDIRAANRTPPDAGGAVFTVWLKAIRTPADQSPASPPG